MNNDRYLATLKHALGGMGRQARADILREIQSHIEELDDSRQSLLDRFGPPEELAKQYLDGEPVQPRLTGRVTGIGKKLLLGIGIVTVSLVIFAVAFVWIVSGDDFNYANEQAEQLTQDAQSWTSAPWDRPTSLKIDQAHAVLYWHDEKNIRWNCKGRQDLPQSPQEPIEIRHASCLVFLPPHAVALDMRQSNVVLVRPRTSVKLAVDQGSLRIAENGERYRYAINARASELDDFISHDDSQLTIAIDANESSIQAYEY